MSAHPELVCNITLIDPVSLLLALPDVAYNFLYRKPSTMMEYIIYFTASREITISHTLHRNFWWYNNVLWLEDVDPSVGVVVALSGQDEILNAETVREYVQICRRKRLSKFHDNACHSETVGLAAAAPIAPITEIFWPGFSHGEFCLYPASQRDLVASIVHNEKHVNM